jgi:hypothetical protein
MGQFLKQKLYHFLRMSHNTVNISLKPWLISNLMHKILIYFYIIHLLKPSTCFEHYPARLQEVSVVIVYMQPLVSSLSAGDCPVHRLRNSWKSTKIILRCTVNQTSRYRSKCTLYLSNCHGRTCLPESEVIIVCPYLYRSYR